MKKMNKIFLSMKSLSDEIYSTDKCLSFKIEKEVYTPYSSFSGIFLMDCDTMNISDIEFFIDDKLIHKGFADVIEEKYEKGLKTIRVVSRGYSSLLCESEMPEGIFSNPSINYILAFSNVPFVEHENSSESINYIYLNHHSSVWEACIMLCLKKHGRYPFVRFPNMVCHSLPETTPFYITENILSKGNLLNLRSAISDVYMRSLTETGVEEDEYTMHLKDSEIRSLGIRREQYYGYDKMWAFDSSLGLRTKINLSLKGMRADFIRYSGFNGEDINDKVVFDNKEGRINRILINGTKNGIQTTLWRYYDRYNNINN